MASPMHDIGKVAILDEVLKKPGKLTEEDFDIMKYHTNIGYNLLKNSTRHILKTAAIVAYQHHEKWNGKGYPCGIKGEDIHIYGRITAIADVFDALGSERVYKKAWELDRILNLFKEERGQHFDPRVVDVFFEQLPNIVKVRDAYSDFNLAEKSEHSQ
jgi:response regulator RpfG family c-di-GMP phosphodiesterase